MRLQKRWVVVFLLFIGGCISYLDRAALSIAAPLIAKDLKLDPSHLGIVFSAFFIGYAPLCFIGGYLSDRLGPKRVLVGAMLFWSLFCGLTATATSVVSLIVLRILFGMGEGPFVANINKLVSNWFPRKQHSSAIALANAGMPSGAAIAGPIVGFLAIQAGWQFAFVSIAVLGVLWVGLWATFASDRPSNAPDGEREVKAANASVAGDTPPQKPLSYYLLRPSTIVTAYAFFGYAYVQFFFLTWFPTYLTTAHGLSIKSMSVATVFPWIGNITGLLLGGFLSDFIFRITGRAIFARKVILVTSLALGAVCIALMATVKDATSAVALMSCGACFMATTYNTYFAIVLDTVEKPRVGAIGGFVHFVSNLAGIVAPLLTGFLVQWAGNFQSAFLLTGSIAASGSLLVLLFVRSGNSQALAVNAAKSSRA